jgi:hypothetical protein
MIIESRVGSGRTSSGLHVEIGLGNRDTTRRTKMVGRVLACYGCREVKPDDVVVYRYGAQNDVVDSSGERLTFLAERHVLFVR